MTSITITTNTQHDDGLALWDHAIENADAGSFDITLEGVDRSQLLQLLELFDPARGHRLQVRRPA